MSMNISDSKRIYSLDLLRILATLGILLYHYQQVFNFTPGIFNCHTSTFNFSYLVEFFFILSGFLAYTDIQRLQRGELPFMAFIRKKYARLLPVIVLPCISYTVISYLFRRINGNGGWFFDTIVDIPATISAILGIQYWGVFTGNNINYPLWYVDVLLFCYILAGVIVKLAGKVRISPVYGFTLIIFLGVCLWNTESGLPFLTMHMARGYYSFFFGLMLSIFYFEYCGENLKKIKTLVFCLAVFALSIVFVLTHHPWFGNYDQYIFTFISYPALIIAFLSPGFQRLFNRKVLGSIGKVTYDIYAWHLVIYFLAAFISLFCRFETASYGSMAVCIILACLMGILSYLCLDKLILSLWQRIKKMFV